MANQCNNFLTLKTDDPNHPLIEWFKENSGAKEGTLPLDLDLRHDAYFFDIMVDHDSPLTYSIYFWTKWNPPIDELVEIGDRYKISWDLQYEELGCGVFGKTRYDHQLNTMQDIYLSDEDLDLVIEDDKTGTVTLHGDEYPSLVDAYLELLNKTNFDI